MFFDIFGDNILNGEYKVLKTEKNFTYLSSIENYVDGKLNGLSKYFDKSGIYVSSTLHENGVLIEEKNDINLLSHADFALDEAQQLAPSGNYIMIDEEKTKVCSYENNKLNGPCYTYVFNNNTGKYILISQENYKEGHLFGEQTYFNSHGKTTLIEIYDKNHSYAVKSTWFEYYPGTKILRSETNFNKNNKDGLTCHYYENGKIKEEINYKNGLIHGAFIRYDESGNKSTEYYEFGSKVKENTPNILE